MWQFLDPLWAALYQGSNDEALPNTIWTKQILVTLKWFQAFFGKGGSRIERFLRIDAYLRTRPIVEFGTDASPWGMGGWLAIDGKITHFFAFQLPR